MSDKLTQNTDLNAELQAELQQEVTEKLAQDVQTFMEKHKDEAGVPVSETESTHEATLTPEISEVETKARELGWRPKGEYTGNNYREPDEYVRNQPLFERIDRQKKELEETKAMAKQAMDHLVALRKESYANAVRNLDAQKMKVVEDGDVRGYQQIDNQIRGLQQQQQADPIINQPVAPQVNQYRQDFETRNASWFNDKTSENREMMAAAEVMDTFLYRQAQIRQGLQTNQEPKIDSVKHLAEIEARVKTEFKHRFENTTREAPATVAKSASSGTRTASQSDLVNRLSDQQKAFGKAFVAHSKGAYTLAMYAQELQDVGALGNK